MPIIVDYATARTPGTAASVIERAAILLLDPDHKRWPEAELITWINEAIGETINLRPVAAAKSMVHTLVAGSLQEVPGDGVQMLDVVRNVAADASTPGHAITRAERGQIDRVEPDWHMKAPSGRIRHYLYDDRTPRLFHVYPPAIGGTKVELSYACLPELIADPAQELGVAPEYEAALVNYVMFRAHSKDSEESGSAQLAASYYQAFLASVQAEQQGSVQTSPNGAKP